MNRPSVLAAVRGAVVAIGVASVINVVLTLVAGDTLKVPGELGLSQVVIFTLSMIVPTAVCLWLLPQWFRAIVLAVAVLSLVFPYQEFGLPIAWWLGAMHLITGICAAVLAPRVAAPASS